MEDIKVCICAIINNEHRYLEEWIEHHNNLGFDTIFLFEETESNSHSEITSKYDNVSLLKLGNIINSTQTRMVKTELTKKFINEFRNDYDWVLFIDVDEFLMLEDKTNVKEVLVNYNDKSAVLLFWKMYNSNGIIDDPKTPVLTTYKETFMISPRIHSPYKPFINLKNFKGDMRNYQELNDFVNVLGFKDNRRPVYEIMWVNKYYTKSWEEWCNKFINENKKSRNFKNIDNFFVINPKMLMHRGKLMKSFNDYKKN